MTQKSNAPARTGARDRETSSATAIYPKVKQKVHHDYEVEAALHLLAEKWPRAFSIYQGRRKPLKIGIREDIAAAVGGLITEAELTKALACYVSNEKYLSCCLRAGAARVGLDGEPAGTVTEDQSRWAFVQLMRARGQRS